jgi:hypothetical protein
MRTRAREIALLFVLGAIACHRRSAPPADLSLADLAQVTDALLDGVIKACVAPQTYGGGEMTMNGASVTAKIVDETGAAVAAQPVSICGIDICSDVGMTAADGTASVMTDLSEKKASFLFGDAIGYAQFAIPLTQATTSFAMGGHVLATGKLSDKTPAALTQGASATSGDVTLTIPADDVITIDLVTYPTSDSQQLRVAGIPVANAAPILASGPMPSFALLYGVSPAETTFCPPVQVSVALPHETMMPNDLGWAPGAHAEFWVTTTDQGQAFAPFGGWAKISDGVVSSDGARVATVPMQGFNFLESFAVRVVP